MPVEVKKPCRRCGTQIVVSDAAFKSGASFKYSLPYDYETGG